MKRTLLLLLTAMACPFAWAGLVFQVGDLTYHTLPDNVSVEVIHLREGYTLDEVQVPEQVSTGGVTYTVTRIGNEAFKDCKTLKHLLFPNGIKEYGAYCFCNCDALLNLSMPNSLLTIEESAFEGCSSMPLIALPNSVTTIGKNAFAYCTNARQVSIPKSVVEIGEGVLKGCSGLEFIYGQHTSSDNKCLIMGNKLLAIAPLGKTSFTIPNNVATIGAYTFSGCSNLKSITIPKSVISIEDMAFNGCTGLNSIELPESVVFLRDRVFFQCTNLQTVILPSALSVIGGYAFDACPSLVTVKSYIVNPATVTLGEAVFGTAPPDVCTLYVPEESVDLYKNATDQQWKNFRTIVGFGGSGVETILGETEGETPVYYDLTGRRVLNPEHGIYIRNGHKVIVK